MTYAQKRKKSLFEPPFRALRDNVYALHIWLIGKPVVDFIFVIIELFRYLLRLIRYERKSVEVGVFRRGVGHFERRFQREGGVAHQPLLISEYSSVIALSCGIKISAVRHLVLSQCTRVTDKRTDGQTDGQNYDSQDRPRICSRGKNTASNVREKTSNSHVQNSPAN